jgi:hypothetical protein
MLHRTAEISLSIEVDSDPIQGSFATCGSSPVRFSGWIQLACALESVRASQAGLPAVEKARALAQQ